jgi:hypothetical protein
MSKQTVLEQLIKISADAKDEPNVKAAADLAIAHIKLLEAENAEQATELETAGKTVIALKDENAKQADALETAANTVIGLQTKIEQLSTGKKIKPSFTFKKDEYEVEHGVNLDNVHYTPEQIAQKADVQKKLVEGGSSAVTKIVTE